MVVESMLRSVLTAYDGLVIKSSFSSPCACASGAAMRPLSPEVVGQPGDKHQHLDGPTITINNTGNNNSKQQESREDHISDDNRALLLRRTGISTGAIDASTSSGKSTKGPSVDPDKRKGKQDTSTAINSDSATSTTGKPIPPSSTTADFFNFPTGNSRPATTPEAGYGLVPEQGGGSADEHAHHSRPPIAKPPTTKGRATLPVHKRRSSDGSYDSSIQGEHLVSMVSDDNNNIGDGRDDRPDAYFSSCTLSGSDAASEDRYCVEDANDSQSLSLVCKPTSPLGLPPTSPSSASPTTTAANATSGNTRSGAALSPPRTPRSGAALSPPRTPQAINTSHALYEQQQRRHALNDGPGGPFSPTNSSCTNPSYISSSSSSEGGLLGIDDQTLEGDDIFSQESRNYRTGIDSGVVTNQEYNIDTEDSREWLRLDSTSGDTRPMAVVHATVTSLPGSKDQPISANTKRLVQRLSSSSLSMTSKDGAGSDPISPRSTKGGLANLDTILMASSSLSVDSEIDFILANSTDNNKGSIASTSIGNSMRKSESGISESLRSALEELQDLDDEDSFDYGSKRNKEDPRSTRRPMPAVNNKDETAKQGTGGNASAADADKPKGCCADEENGVKKSSDECSLSLSSFEDMAATVSNKEEKSSPGFLWAINENQPLAGSCEAFGDPILQDSNSMSQALAVAKASVENTRAVSNNVMQTEMRMQPNIVPVDVKKKKSKILEQDDWCGTFSDLSASRAPLDSMVTTTACLNVEPNKVQAEDHIISAQERYLRENTCIAMKELEQDYQERVDEMKRQYVSKLDRLKRQLDLKLHRSSAAMLRLDDDLPAANKESNAHTSTGVGLNVIVADVNEDVTTSTGSTDINPPKVHSKETKKTTGTGNDPVVSETKRRKDAMEERLHNLLNKLHSPGRQRGTTSLVEHVAGVPPSDADIDTNSTPDFGKCLNCEGKFSAAETVEVCQRRGIVAVPSQTARTTLASIHGQFLLQKASLQADLDSNAKEESNRLDRACKEKEVEQFQAMAEISSLRDQLQSQQQAYDKESAQTAEIHRARIDDTSSKIQHNKEEFATNCSALADEIAKQEKSIDILTSKLEETKRCNKLFKEKVETQDVELAHIREESARLQSHVVALNQTAENIKREQDEQLCYQKAKLDDSRDKVRQEVSDAIDRQYLEGNKKCETLEEEQCKVVERLGALKKLLLIKEASNSSMVEEWKAREEKLVAECKGLNEAITFTEEKKGNKAAAFIRVKTQLNESYNKLMTTVEETRQGMDSIQAQTRDVSVEISQLRADNTQVDGWIKELMAVVTTLE